MAEPGKFERLPKSVRPRHYQLEFEPDLEAFTFQGVANITIDVTDCINSITLSCLNLKIQSATLHQEEGCEMTDHVEYDETTERATIEFQTCIPRGSASLCLNFTGVINDNLKGWFKSKQELEDGSEKICAITHFEPNSARECFPCWDEPALKATFDISITIPDGLVALSNMDIREQEVKCDKRIIHFNTTPKMSTYLVAMAVGEYDFIEGFTNTGIRVRVYTPTGKRIQGKFALEAGIGCLEVFGELTDIPYSLPKMDMLSAGAFGAGAMENWGLVIYKEDYLLFDPERSTTVLKKVVVEIVGHELAHQWFGNLVTIEWWGHLWLNEGFATFYEHIAAFKLHPEFGAWVDFLGEEFYSSMDADSSPFVHPIETVVGTTEEIRGIFDMITYKKGGSILRMIRNYMGDELYRKGITNYLKKHQYGNAVTDDLCTALGEACDKPIGAMLSSWTRQPGHPILTVSERQEADKRVLTISQARYTNDAEAEVTPGNWIIPISVLTSKCLCGSTVTTIMDSPQMTLTICDICPNDWVKLNPGTMDYYRVMYPMDMLERLLGPIREQTMPVLDRIGVLRDVAAMCTSGRQPISTVMQVLQSYRNESHDLTWEAIAEVLADIDAIASYTDLKPDFDKFVLELYFIIRRCLSWDPVEGEPYADKRMRFRMMEVLSKYGDEEIKREAKTRFEDHVAGKRQLSPDAVFMCLSSVMRVADVAMFEQVLKVIDSLTMPFERSRALMTLGKAQDPEVLQRVFEYALSDAVKPENVLFPIYFTNTTSKGRSIGWNFLKENQELLAERYKGQRRLSTIVLFLTHKFGCEAKALEIECHFEEHPMPEAAGAIQAAIRSIRLRSKIIKRDYQALSDFLRVGRCTRA